MDGILFPTNLAYGSIQEDYIRGSILWYVRLSYHTSHILRSILSRRSEKIGWLEYQCLGDIWLDWIEKLFRTESVALSLW